jgi:hypothetical protein
MRESLATLFFVCCSIFAATQQNHTYIYMYDNAVAPSVAYTSNIDGVTIPVLQTSVDYTSCSGTCTLDFNSHWSTADAGFTNWTGQSCGLSLRGVSTGCTVNLSIKSVANGTSNTWAPQYIFTQDWANYAAQNNVWAASTTYPIGFTITCTGYPGCPAATHYYQMVSTPTNGLCQSASGAPPNPPGWPSTGGTVVDGTCTWKDQQPVNAPLQDVAVSSNYPGAIPSWCPSGGGGPPCSYKQGAIITCGATGNSCLSHFYQETNSTSPCTTGSGNPGTNWPTTGGTYKMDGNCWWKDLGSTAALNYGTNPTTDTISVVASGVPAIWETPFSYSQGLFYQNALKHYIVASVGSVANQIKYIRTGMGIGEEASISGATGFEKYLAYTLTDAQLKGVWTNRALHLYANNAATVSGISATPRWVLMALVNCGTGLATAPGTDCTWADVEAQGALNHAPYYGGYGSQGLQTADLFLQQNIAQCQIPFSGKNCCSDNWCETRYYMIAAIPYIELQELCISTPAGGSGCIDDPNNPNASLSEVLVLATQHGTNVIELGVPEFQCAYDSSSSCFGTSAATATAAAIQTAATGLPSGTSALSGKAQIQGQTTTF